MSVDLKNKYLPIILLTVVVLFGFLLRIHKFDSVPRIGATFDEFAWTWLGMSILDGDTPRSWSPHSLYEEREQVQYLGAWFLLVRPYLEHPPLFGLVAGGFAKLNGVDNIFLVTTYKIRPLAIGLGVLSILLVYLFVKEAYGKTIALLSSLLYASVPTIVIGSKLVQNENFLIPLWLASLFFLQKYLKTKNKKYKYLAFVLAGILPLAKIPWLVASFSLSLILSYNKKWRDACEAFIIAIFFFSLFILYGFYWDGQLFIDLFRFQLARYDISFAGIYSLFTNPLLVDRGYIDGWIFMGWISILLLLGDLKKYQWILLPFVAYFVLFVFAIPDEPGHGWYRYPFYVFSLIALSIVFFKEYNKTTLMSFFIFLLISLSILSNTWYFSFGFSYLVLRVTVLLLCTSFFLPIWFNNLAFLKKPVFLLWMALLMVGNIWSVLGFIE